MKGIFLTILFCYTCFDFLACKPQGYHQSNGHEGYKYTRPPENQAPNGVHFSNNGNNQFGYQSNGAKVNNFGVASNKRVIATQVWKLDERSGDVSVKNFYLQNNQGYEQKISFVADRNGYRPQSPSFGGIGTDIFPLQVGGYAGVSAMMINLGGRPSIS